jgi:hypothetical protein
MEFFLWAESQKERAHWEDQDVGGWTIKMDIREIVVLICLRIGNSGGLL